MRVFAIDPGTYQSAYVMLDPSDNSIINKGLIKNDDLLWLINTLTEDADIGDNVVHLVVEMVASYGMAVGKEVFETCVWTGKFINAWKLPKHHQQRMYRRDVKLCLCGSMKAKDSNIRQAILDMYEPTGGGSTPQVGTKSAPGPLYGVKKDIFAALAVGITFSKFLAGEFPLTKVFGEE